MDSLITVDEEALTEAFGFDESSLSEGMAGAFDFSSAFGQAGDSLDLSGAVDLSGIDLTLPDMGTLNLGDIMGDLDISISSEVFGDMASGLLAGYQEYAEEHPEADYSGLGDAFAAFMQTPEGQEILSRNIQEIIQSGGGMEISSDQIRQLFQDILAGYAEYVQEMGYEDAYQDPEQFSVYLTEYLGTAEAQRFWNSGDRRSWQARTLQFQGSSCSLWRRSWRQDIRHMPSLREHPIPVKWGSILWHI